MVLGFEPRTFTVSCVRSPFYFYYQAVCHSLGPGWVGLAIALAFQLLRLQARATMVGRSAAQQFHLVSQTQLL